MQSLGTDHNENMTYCSVLRDFADFISTLNLSMLPSEIQLYLRLNERGYEHHSQHRPSAKVYQCTIHKYTITVCNSTLLFLLHMVTYTREILTTKYSYKTLKWLNCEIIAMQNNLR